MTVKLLEIRDRGTCIQALAVGLRHRDDAERYLLRRAGYAAEQIDGDVDSPYVVLWRLAAGGEASYDPFSWGNRTMKTAHRSIIANWRTLKSGDVVDVEYILRETAAPKVSERLTHPEMV